MVYSRTKGGFVSSGISKDFWPLDGSGISADDYFEILISELGGEPKKLVVVCHAISSLPPFLRALRLKHDVSVLLVKPRSIIEEYRRKASDFCRTEVVSRDVFNDPDATSRFFDDIGVDSRTVIIDIGGYFHNVPKWIDCGTLSHRIFGIVEDTENGHRKYERHGDCLTPVVSIARCIVKSCEDRWVSNAIVFSAERLLRYIGKTYHKRKIAVIGYGKIGWGVASTLRSLGHNVCVYDKDYAKRLQAEANGLDTPARTDVIAESNVIFCATGNNALTCRDLGSLRNGAIIFSVTSADDEFGFPLDDCPVVDGSFSAVTRPSKEAVYFANSGNAVNFLDGGHIGHYASLVQGAILAGIYQLEHYGASGGLRRLNGDLDNLVAGTYYKMIDKDGGLNAAYR